MAPRPLSGLCGRIAAGTFALTSARASSSACRRCALGSACLLSRGGAPLALDYHRGRDRARDGQARGYEHREPEAGQKRLLDGAFDLYRRLFAYFGRYLRPAEVYFLGLELLLGLR